jgi:hypothetical protein
MTTKNWPPAGTAVQVGWLEGSYRRIPLLAFVRREPVQLEIELKTDDPGVCNAPGSPDRARTEGHEDPRTTGILPAVTYAVTPIAGPVYAAPSA